jgi:hypothetical protein
MVLHCALTLYGFLTKKGVLHCYIKSTDPYYHEKDNLAYSQLYYIQF